VERRVALCFCPGSQTKGEPKERQKKSEYNFLQPEKSHQTPPELVGTKGFFLKPSDPRDVR
jgi:hypothetical protein